MFAAWLKNQSISRKFALSLAIFLVAPLIALGLFVNLPLAQRMDRQNCQTNLEILKQTATPIEYMIEDVLYISLEVIGHDGLQAYLKSGGTENDRLSIQYDINRLLTSREYITRLSVYRREGIAIQFGAYLPAESDGRFEQLDALGGRYMWTCAALEEGYLSRGDRRYEVSMLRAVNDLDVYGRVLGYERINVSEDYLCSLYSGIASDSTLDIFILDAQGRVVSAMDKSRLGGEVELDVVKGAEGFALGGEDKLLSWYSIPGVGWRVVKLDRASAILDRRLANLVLGFAIALTLFFGLCFYFVQRRSVIRPVRLLLSDVENVCDGQYDVSLHTASRDEIGQLNRGIMDMTERLRDLIERVYKLRIRQQEAQLKALSMQINPHFLYNTLDTLRFTALRRGEKDIARYVEALSSLFRHALNEGSMIPLSREVDFLRDYALIQQFRFGDRLKIDIDMDPALGNMAVPNMILQPLVENAIEHGLRPRVGPGVVTVSIYSEGESVYCRVCDDGVGCDIQAVNRAIAQNAQGHALANIDQRIKYRYGTEYGVSVSGRAQGGTCALIRLPGAEVIG